MVDKLKILVTAIGSAGDVHPFLGVGRALKLRGHDVVVFSSGYFEQAALDAGLDFVPLGTSEDFLKVTNDPDLWHPTKAPRLILNSVVGDALKPTYEKLVEAIEPGRTVLVSSTLGLVSRIVEDRHNVPAATVHLAPAVFRSLYRQPRMGGPGLPDWAPRFLKRFFWGAARVVIDRMAAPRVNELRKEVGLAPVKDIFFGWWNSPRRVIGLFPEWYAAPQPDWPGQLRLTGFPLYDEGTSPEPPADVADYLAEGEPPVVFTPGSANQHGAAFLKAAVEACRIMNRRGMLLTQFSEQVPADLPEGVRHFKYIPFSQVLPRAAALVYHGGVGTMAQALKAGIPHFVMPMAHDQFDNLSRLKELGVGDGLRVKKFTGQRLAKRLSTLLTNQDIVGACKRLAEKFEGVDPLTETCELIEELAGISDPGAVEVRGNQLA